MPTLDNVGHAMAGPAAPSGLQDYLTVTDAAALLGVSSKTLRRWDRANKLKAVRHPVNRYRLYRREDLEALVRQVTGAPRKAHAAGPHA